MDEHEKLNGATALAKGLESLLAPVAEEIDTKVVTMLSSQAHLSENVDRLSRILQRLLDSTPEPVIASHATKLTDIRGRVSNMSSSIATIQERLHRLQAMRARLPESVASKPAPPASAEASAGSSSGAAASEAAEPGEAAAEAERDAEGDAAGN